MEMLATASKRLDCRRLFGMLVGVCLCGMGVSTFKLATMGTDAYSALVFALADRLSIGFGTMLPIMHGLFFLVQLIFGRRMIGLGTIVNWLCVGYIADFITLLFGMLFPNALPMAARVITMLAGVVIICLGGSMYQTANMGIAPYDALSLIMAKRLPIPYFWCRIFTDATCFVLALLLGGMVGVGTLVCAVGLGPVIHFFDVHVSRPLIRSGLEKEHQA